MSSLQSLNSRTQVGSVSEGGFAADQCGKAAPYRSRTHCFGGCASFCAPGGIASKSRVVVPVRHSLTALVSGKAAMELAPLYFIVAIRRIGPSNPDGNACTLSISCA
jgi:hypothetical protein